MSSFPNHASIVTCGNGSSDFVHLCGSRSRQWNPLCVSSIPTHLTKRYHEYICEKTVTRTRVRNERKNESDGRDEKVSRSSPESHNDRASCFSRPISLSDFIFRGGNSSGAKNPPANAWSKPLAVSKKSTTSPPPGLSTTKPAGASTPKVQELEDLRGRFVNLLLALTGQKVTVTTLSGESISGILHTVTPFPNIDKARRNKYVLKGVKGKGNYVIDMEKVAQLHVPSCRLESTHQGFTDAEIAAKEQTSNHAGGDLVQADASWTAASPSTSQLSGEIDGWDQFKANEKLFNVKAQFDENIYTTALDRSQVSNKDKKRAEQLAREIEKTATKNIHLAEERNQVSNQDYDEEDRYSGVLKQPAAPKLNYAQAAAGKEKATEKGGSDEAKAEGNGGKEANDRTIEPVTQPKVDGKDIEAELETLSTSDPSPPPQQTKGDSNNEDSSKPAGAAEGSISKLNAAAKKFSFNVNAQEFKPPTPTQLPHQMPPHPSQLQPPAFHQQQFAVDANTGMPIIMPSMSMQPST